MTAERPITICMVLASRGFGGLEKHFIDLCDGLSRRHNVIAVADREFEQPLHGRVTFEPIDVSRSRHNPLFVLALRRILRRHRPDVVHAHANKAATLVKRAAIGLPYRRVATIHNLKTATRMFTGFDSVIAVSRAAAERVTGSQVQIVYNGIDAPAVTRALHGPPPAGVTPPYVAAVGRLVPAKGFDILIEAWAGVPAKLVIAGDGPQRPLIEKLIAGHRLQDAVQLLGHCDEVPALLANASLTVVSSRHEGFGYVCAESLFAGTPIVSTRVPVANEILPSRWLAPPEDAAALRRVILDGLRNAEALERDMEPVYAFAREHFTRDGMIEHTVDVYRAVLAGDRTGAGAS